MWAGEGAWSPAADGYLLLELEPELELELEVELDAELDSEEDFDSEDFDSVAAGFDSLDFESAEVEDDSAFELPDDFEA